MYVADAANAKVRASVRDRRKYRQQADKAAADEASIQHSHLMLAFDSEVELHGWFDRITRMLVQTNKTAEQLLLESQPPPPIAVAPQTSATGSPLPIDLRRESVIFAAAATSPGSRLVVPPSLDPGVPRLSPNLDCAVV